VNLPDLLRDKAAKAIGIAYEGGDGSSKAMAEWSAFLRTHPRIREVLEEKTESESPGVLYRLGKAVSRAAHKVTR